MMTVLSARWADETQSAAIIETAERGAVVAYSGSPEAYEAFTQWRLQGGQVSEYTDPVVPVSFTPLQFIDRFTETEQNAITQAAMSNAAVNLWLLKCMGATEVVTNDPRTIAGMDALVAAGLLTAERRDEILGVS